MKFVSNIKKEEYKKFYKKFNTASFMQSYEWGEFCIKGKGQKPYYVGMKDDNNNLVCAALLLKTTLPLGLSYFYSPRGYLIDFKNLDLLEEFTNNLKKFIKKEKGIYLKVDPEVIYQTLSNDALVIPGENNYELHKYLIKIGYKHKGFNKLYEHNQPRYTFIIDLTNDYENKMNKSFLKNINKSKEYCLEFIVGNKDNLKDFNYLYQKTKERDNFNGYSNSYYEHFYDLLNKEDMAQIFLVKIYPSKIINNLNNKLNELNNELSTIKNPNKKELINKTITRINKELSLFYKYKDKKDGMYISAHIMAFSNDTATALYAGSDKDFQCTYANNFMYYEKIKYAKDKGYKYLDLFGVTGDPKTEYKNLAGIFEFKKNLGGDLKEFIGEYDLISNKFMYKFINIAIPIYRKIVKLIRK